MMDCLSAPLCPYALSEQKHMLNRKLPLDEAGDVMLMCEAF